MTGEKSTSGVATQFLAAFVANIISLYIGFTVGWTAVAIPVLESNRTLDGANPLDEPLTKVDTSWLTSLSMLASIFGPTPCSLMVERWGYKPAGYVVGVSSALAGVIVVLAHSFLWLLAGRVLIGVFTAGAAVVSTNYAAAIAQAHVRGAVGTVFALMFNAGVLVAYLVGAASSYFTVCVVGVVIPTVYAACLFFVPESPLHLLSKGREQEAAKSLRWLRAGGHDVAGELKQMQLTLQSSRQAGDRNRMTAMQFFRDCASRRALAAALVLVLNQQLSGSMVALSYVVEMLAAAGGGAASAEWSAVAVAVLQLAATFASSALVDRAGRRPLLLGSNAGIAACHAALGGYFFARASGLDVSAAWWLPATALSLFLVLNAVGVGALLMVVVNEFFSPEAMPVAMSVIIGAQTVVTSAVVRMYVVLLDWLQAYGTFWFFGACCLLCNVYIFFFLPESKNRPISDILTEMRGETKKKRKRAAHYDAVHITESQT